MMKLLYCVFSFFLTFSLGAFEMYAVSTDDAPKAIGPYSQAIRVDNFLFVSGQIPIDPKTGAFAGKDIETQTEQVLKNIEAILAKEGLSFENVVKTEVYMKDLSHFTKMNEIYGKWFSHDPKPARQALEVARLPKDALIEISCIAWVPSS